MLKKISYNLHSVEKLPYFSYGLINHPKNQDPNSTKNTSQKDNFIYQNATNPFEKDTKNKYQSDFDENYRNIELFVKRAKFELSKGSTKSIVSSAVLEAGALVSGYLYNKILPKNSTLINEKGKKSIRTFDEDEKLLIETEIARGDISKIKLYKNDFDYVIEMQKRSVFDRLFNTNKLTLKQCQKFDKEGNLIEQIKYSKNGKVESYLEKDDSITQEILFDTTQYGANSDFLPSQYNLYKNNSIIKSLKYSYAVPLKYKEYNETTSKITKVFNLQGIKHKVCKYSFYNSLNGNLITSGTI